MRVIAGKYKGRKLEAPQGREIRPTTDKTKEAVFSMIGFQIPEARVLDIFSGTGALGIEALSRGADLCVFCDKSKAAIGQINANLQHCGIEMVGIREAASRAGSAAGGDEADDQEPVAAVVPGDVEKTLPYVAEVLPLPFHVILMDPPYGRGLCEKTMKIIEEEGLLDPEGIIICEHPKEEELPEEVGEFLRIKERRYGISRVSVYRK